MHWFLCSSNVYIVGTIIPCLAFVPVPAISNSKFFPTEDNKTNEEKV